MAKSDVYLFGGWTLVILSLIYIALGGEDSTAISTGAMILFIMSFAESKEECK